jgi:hypothetical protein
MTKRELCERLMEIRDYVRETDTWRYKNDERNLALHNASVVIAKDLRDIILDLAAPETEEEKEEAFRERCRAVFGDLAEPEEETK